MTDAATAPAPPGTPARASHRVEDARLLTGHGTFVDDIVAARDAARVLRAQPVRPGARSAGSTPSAALALPGRARRVHRRRPQPRRQGAVAHLDRAGRARRRRARRSPTTRCASSATRSRWSSPTSRYLAEDAAELVDVDYEPLPRRRRLHRRREDADALVHEAPRLERRRRARRAARRRRSTTCSPRPRTW